MKRLMLAIAFTCVLSFSALAGETSTPPGETQTPPGETSTPPGIMEAPQDTLVTVLLTVITWPR